MAILPREANALLELFCLQPIIFGWKQNISRIVFVSWGKTKIHGLHQRVRLDRTDVFKKFHRSGVAVDCIPLNYWGKHKRKMEIRGN